MPSRNSHFPSSPLLNVLSSECFSSASSLKPFCPLTYLYLNPTRCSPSLLALSVTISKS